MRTGLFYVRLGSLLVRPSGLMCDIVYPASSYRDQRGSLEFVEAERWLLSKGE